MNRVLLPRARVRLQTGSINEAEKDVSRVLERAPKDVMASYMKASIQLLRGDANAARATFQPIECHWKINVMGEAHTTYTETGAETRMKGNAEVHTADR